MITRRTLPATGAAALAPGSLARTAPATGFRSMSLTAKGLREVGQQAAAAAAAH